MKFLFLAGALLITACGADESATGVGLRHQVQGVAEFYSDTPGVAGVLTFSRQSYGGYFESVDGDGVRGISVNNDGGKFSTSSPWHGGVRVENNAGPQIVFSGDIATQLPEIAPPGSLMVVRERDRLRLAFAATESEWLYLTP